MINTLILDLDGPVLDGRMRHYQCYQEILTQHGYEPMPSEQYWNMKRQRKDRHAQLAISGADEIYDQFLSLWLERIEQKEYLMLDRVQPGAVEAMKDWQTRGLNINLVTMRNHSDNLLWQLEQLGILSLFNAVRAVGTSSGSAGKASAARTLIGQSDVKSVLWIGDTEADIEAAHLLGIRICLIENGLRVPDYLASLKPDFQTPDIQSIIFLRSEV
jgi:phosphoglycolate phosphatase